MIVFALVSPPNTFKTYTNEELDFYLSCAEGSRLAQLFASRVFLSRLLFAFVAQFQFRISVPISIRRSTRLSVRGSAPLCLCVHSGDQRACLSGDQCPWVLLVGHSR